MQGTGKHLASLNTLATCTISSSDVGIPIERYQKDKNSGNVVLALTFELQTNLFEEALLFVLFPSLNNVGHHQLLSILFWHP